jgi:hypothetical protein
MGGFEFPTGTIAMVQSGRHWRADDDASSPHDSQFTAVGERPLTAANCE